MKPSLPPIALNVFVAWLMFFEAFLWLDVGRSDVARGDFAIGAINLVWAGLMIHLRRRGASGNNCRQK